MTSAPSPARVAGTAVGLLAAAGVAAFAWGALVERNRFRVRSEIVPVLAPGARPITVLHLSDLHMAPWQREKQTWIRRMAELVEPDFVVATGDLLGHEEGLRGLRSALAPLAGIPGVFVNGSNDYYGPTRKNWLGYLAGPSHQRPGPGPKPALDTAALTGYLVDELGWLDLDNRARAIELRGSRLVLLGTDDPHVHRDRLDVLTALADELRESVEWDGAPEPVTIGVTHAPYRRILDFLVTQGADLVFAGHTHGGQVCVPGVGALVTNCDLPRAQASGLSTWQHARRTAYLEVSAGLGTSIMAPVRFACPPEAVVLTLVARD